MAFEFQAFALDQEPFGQCVFYDMGEIKPVIRQFTVFMGEALSVF